MAGVLIPSQMAMDTADDGLVHPDRLRWTSF